MASIASGVFLSVLKSCPVPGAVKGSITSHLHRKVSDDTPISILWNFLFCSHTKPSAVPHQQPADCEVRARPSSLAHTPSRGRPHLSCRIYLATHYRQRSLCGPSVPDMELEGVFRCCASKENICILSPSSLKLLTLLEAVPQVPSCLPNPWQCYF